MEMIMLLGMVLGAGLLVVMTPVTAYAHCDTMDGPTAKDGMKALETGNINYALKWIAPEFEAELHEIFSLSRKVRVLNDDAKTLADRFFMENLVRIHRAGEGAPFEGLKPHGTPIDEKVAAADRCIEAGNLTPLDGLVPPEVMAELKEKFDKAMALKDFNVNDVAAAREYIEAYVHFFKLAEGEDHEGHEGHEGHASPHASTHAGPEDLEGHHSPGLGHHEGHPADKG